MKIKEKITQELINTLKLGNLAQEQEELISDVDAYMKDLEQWKLNKKDREQRFKEEERRVYEIQDKERVRMIERKYEDEDEIEK